MKRTLHELRPKLSIAGWYTRDGKPIYEHILPILRSAGYETRVGLRGRVYAWANSLT
jgi:hypothetical protein